MSIRSARILQLIAVILYGCALIGIVLITVLQGPVFRLFYSYLYEEAEGHFVIPVMPFVCAMIYFILALIALMILFSRPKGPLWLVILMVILFALMGAFFSPVGSTLGIQLYARMGAVSLAAYSSLSNLCSMVSGAFCAPALILMFLALGGSLNPKSFGGGAQAQSYPGGQTQAFPGGQAPRPQYRETDTDHVLL